MLIFPQYAEDIIVGVTKNGIFRWYIANKLIWYLDFLKYCKAGDPDFTEENDSDVVDRFNIFTVDSEHEAEYLKCLAPYQVETEELRSYMELCDKEDDIYDFFVSLLVDFDNKHLISYFPEPDPLDKYIPDDWTSEYRPISDDVPKEMRYWISESGKNMFCWEKKQ